MSSQYILTALAFASAAAALGQTGQCLQPGGTLGRSGQFYADSVWPTLEAAKARALDIAKGETK